MSKQSRQYQQLTQGQRYQLQALYTKGFSQREIAEVIGVHYSSVSRELSRNKTEGIYCADTAERLKDKRKSTAYKHHKFDETHEKILREGLLMGWSPEKMSCRMPVELDSDRCVSHTTFYRYIEKDRTTGGTLYRKLPRFGKRRCKGGKRKAGRSMIPNREDIRQRPAIVEQRVRLGDFEGDTVHGQDAYLVTLVDRTSRLLLMGKSPDKTADSVAKVMTSLLRRVDTVHTITLDNGGEFAEHGKVSQATEAAVYFARAYASYQRGTNENTNGLIRRTWPKKTAFGSLTDKEISDLELKLNLTPRKILNGLTPIEVYTGCVLHLLC